MNYRNTKQKTLILSIIEKYGHLTIEQIKNLLEDENVSIATIYRNLNILTEEGKIKKVCSDNITVYETIKASAVNAAEPIAKPLPVAAVVLPRESRASVLSRTVFSSPDISAIPPALSATGP